MKRLVVALAILAAFWSTAAIADAARDKHVAAHKAHLEKSLKEQGVETRVIIQDEQESITIDPELGEGPLVIVRLPEIGRECAVAIHPKDPKLAAVLMCLPISEEKTL